MAAFTRLVLGTNLPCRSVLLEPGEEPCYMDPCWFKRISGNDKERNHEIAITHQPDAWVSGRCSRQLWQSTTLADNCGYPTDCDSNSFADRGSDSPTNGDANYLSHSHSNTGNDFDRGGLRSCN